MADLDSYRQFYRRSLRPLAAHLRALGARDQQDLEDVLQETFVEAFRSWSSLKDEGARLAWLFTIGRRQLWQHRTRNKRHLCAHATMSGGAPEVMAEGAMERHIATEAASDAVAASSDDTLVHALHTQSLTKQIKVMIDAIPDVHKREVITLFYLNDLALPDISAATGIKTSTLTTWLSRFREQARRAFSDASADAPRAMRPATKSSRIRLLASRRTAL